jgi:hypothetical protein
VRAFERAFSMKASSWTSGSAVEDAPARIAWRSSRNAAAVARSSSSEV